MLADEWRPSKLQHYWERPEYLEDSRRLEETCGRLNSSERPSALADMDLTRELKKLWNMKVIIIPFVIGALGTVTKGLLKCLEDLKVSGRVKTIQTTALLKTARILRRVLENWWDLLSLNIQWKPSAYADVKTLMSNNNKKTENREY